MAPPSNQTAATAIMIPAIPYTTSQNAVDAGIGYDLWYKYTATTNTVLSIICFSGFTTGSTTYRPLIHIYSSDDPNDADPFDIEIGSQNRPLQVMVGAGKTYFIEIRPNNSTITVGGTVSINIIGSTSSNFPAGAIFVNDDTGYDPSYGVNEFLPGYFANPSTGAIYTQRSDIVSGEQGDVLTNGRFILSDEYSSPERFVIYKPDLTRDATTSDPTLVSYVGNELTSNHVDRFYITKDGPASGVQPEIKTLDQNGVVVGTWTLNVNPVSAERFIRTISSSLDDQVLYYGVLTADMSIRRYDLVNRVNMTDLHTGSVAGAGTSTRLGVVIALGNGTILATYHRPTSFTSDPADWSLVNFAPDGTILHIYNYTEAADGDLNRVVRSSVNPNSVWVWLMPPAGAAGYIMAFREIDINTGAILNEFQSTTYQNGAYDGPETGTPESRFGHPISCPVIQLSQPNEPLPPAPPGIVTITGSKTDIGQAIPTPTFRTALLP